MFARLTRKFARLHKLQKSIWVDCNTGQKKNLRHLNVLQNVSAIGRYKVYTLIPTGPTPHGFHQGECCWRICSIQYLIGMRSRWHQWKTLGTSCMLPPRNSHGFIWGPVLSLTYGDPIYRHISIFYSVEKLPFQSALISVSINPISEVILVPISTSTMASCHSGCVVVSFEATSVDTKRQRVSWFLLL